MKIALRASIVLCLLGCAVSHAGVIFVGVESDAAATGWSDPKATKTFAAEGHVYGASGYYVLVPDDGQGNTSTPVVNNDIAGPKNQVAMPTQISRPPALAKDPWVVGGLWVNFPNYSMISKPDSKAGDFRVGAISSETVEGGNVGAYKDFTYFLLKPGESVRLGILVDALGQALHAAEAISVRESSTGNVVYSEPLSRDGVPDLVVFDLMNTSGSEVQFDVALHTKIPGITGFSLLTFDPLP